MCIGGMRFFCLACRYYVDLGYRTPRVPSEVILTNAVYKGTEIPFNADPYGDLVRDYWPSVRRLVRRFLFLL